MTENKRLTVGQLIDLLSFMRSDAEVWIDDSHRHFSAPVVGVEDLLASVDGRVYLFPAE